MTFALQLRAFAPAILLFVVAIHQLYRTRVEDLSVWKGGGFGMFASVDEVNARFVRASVLSAGQRSPLVLPKSVEPDVLRACAHPTISNMDRVLAKLVQIEWVQENPLKEISITPTVVRPREEALQMIDKTVQVETITLELWKYGFDAKSGDLTSKQLRLRDLRLHQNGDTN